MRERIRTGLWFIPLVAVVAAWAVSSLLHRLDESLGGDRPAFLAYDGSSRALACTTRRYQSALGLGLRAKVLRSTATSPKRGR